MWGLCGFVRARAFDCVVVGCLRLCWQELATSANAPQEVWEILGSEGTPGRSPLKSSTPSPSWESVSQSSSPELGVVPVDERETSPTSSATCSTKATVRLPRAPRRESTPQAAKPRVRTPQKWETTRLRRWC